MLLSRVAFSSSRGAHLGRIVSIAAALALSVSLVSSCGSGGSTSAESTGSGGTSACATDCSTTPATPVCDPATGQCVQCLAGSASCGAGHFCDATTLACLPGCTANSDCSATLVCNLVSHRCVDCASDTQCAPGTICGPTGVCAPGCSPSQPCGAGADCCTGACADLETDPAHCGACDTSCADLPGADAVCAHGSCAISMCKSGFADCNGDVKDGCEWDITANGPCACTPGDTKTCYTGPPGTLMVGACASGTAECDATGTQWGDCSGETIPTLEVCNDGIDNDCDGQIDNVPDEDGDGWTACQGDCCDSPSDGCGNPALVNPGAFEVAGNQVDDDCDGVVDNVLAGCDGGLVSNSGVALDYAKAIDLCATTVENPATPQQKKWGVISASFAMADGLGSPPASSKSIRSGFGSGVAPLKGSRLAVLSTGVAAAQAAPNNASPAWVAFQGGQNSHVTSGVPADWLAANGGNFPNAPGCPDPQGGATANDPVMLRLRVRTPTNARSFTVSTFFYSSEYPEWVCSAFNDFFLTLLDSKFVAGPGQVANPTDKNLAFYDPPPAGGPVYPVGVNLAFGNTGLFSQCVNGPTGCGSGAVPGSTNTCNGISQIVGTGFDMLNPPSQFAADPAVCGPSNRAGGGTGWLSTSGNIQPGETIDLRFVTWDTGDGWYDSVVLLDNFTWSVNASTPGTHQ